MVIIVTGTPGTGKTKIARFLSKALRYTFVDVHSLLRSKKLWSSYDKQRKCYVVDKKKLVKRLLAEVKKNKESIFDSHMSHNLPKKYVELCIVTHCDITLLKKRLEQRKYSRLKTRENLDAEIFQTCLTEAQELGHQIIEVDTTKTFDKKKLLKEVRKWIS